MLRIRIGICLALVAGAVGLTAEQVMAQPGGFRRGGGFGGGGGGPGYVDVSVFYESLAQFGEWIQMPPYGWVWMPYGVSYDWRPYTDGYWAWTDCGWTWMSNEPFGWATYHYGRWHYSPWHGWVWVPGTQWGPAWVAWRRGDGWLGWAPLPAHANTSTSVNIQIGNFNLEVNQIRRHAWSFVEERRFCEPSLTPYIARPVRNVNIINSTQNVTNYNIVNNTIVNNSVSVQTIENRIRRKITPLRIQDMDRPGNPMVQQQNNMVRFFRPKLNMETKKTPDVLIKKPGNVTITPEMMKRQNEERASVEAKIAAERAQLLDRQRRELARIGKLGVTPDELKRRHKAEEAALEEQSQREKKLVDRFYDRVKKGEVGKTTADQPRFKINRPGLQPQGGGNPGKMEPMKPKR